MVKISVRADKGTDTDGQTARKHNAFADSVGRQRHENNAASNNK